MATQGPQGGVSQEAGIHHDVTLQDQLEEAGAPSALLIHAKGISGRELIDRLLVTVPDAKVIFMSGYTDDRIADRGVLDPGVNFLQKPFSMGDLGTSIRSALG